MSSCLDNFKKGIYIRRKKLTKTFTWRAIATSTTFSVAYALTGDASKAGAVAAVDTVLKTFFYYFHESFYDKATKKNWMLCREDDNEGENDEMVINETENDMELKNQEISIKVSQI